jgi:hypothetical protein
MRPLVFQCFSGRCYIDLTPWPIGQALVSQVSLQDFFVSLQGLLSFHTFTGVHFGTYLFRASLVHLTEFSQSSIVIDTKIHMVLDIPQGDPVPLSRHC